MTGLPPQRRSAFGPAADRPPEPDLRQQTAVLAFAMIEREWRWLTDGMPR